MFGNFRWIRGLEGLAYFHGAGDQHDARVLQGFEHDRSYTALKKEAVISL